MYNIVFLDSATMPKPFPKFHFPHQLTTYRLTSAQQAYERCKDADIIITNKVVFNRDLLSHLPKLKLIALTATGMNNIDLKASEDLGILVKNVAGYSNRSVTEHALGMIFCLRRRFLDFHQDIQAGKWQNHPQFCFFEGDMLDVAQSTIGIVGKGNLGQTMASLATNIGMKVLFAEHKNVPMDQCREGYTPFSTVLAQSDIISLHCPLTSETQKLMGLDEFKKMKKSALFINTGRGPLVDENALAIALKSGLIAGAGLDVLSTEPPERSNPLLDPSLPNLLLTPHVAWGSESSLTTLVEKVVANIENFVAKNTD